MTLEEKLEKLIRLLKESKLAERLKESNDKWGTFDNEMERIKEELKDFKKDADKQFADNCSILDRDYQIVPENALEIVLICVMTEVDDDDMFTNWRDLSTALRQIEGNLHEIAVNIADFLEGIGEETPGYFSEYEYGGEFIEEFF